MIAAASRSWVASAVSTMSDDVSPKWRYLPSSPSVSWTPLTKAAMSCPCSASSSLMRSTLMVAVRSLGSASRGTMSSSAQPSAASSSISSQRASRDSSLKISAISGGV